MRAVVGVVLVAVTAMSLESIPLPSARSTRPLRKPRPPVVLIDLEEIRVDGELVEKTDKLLQDGYWAAPGLEAKLTALRASSPRGKRLVFAIHAHAPFMLFKKALFTANKTGFARVDLAVWKPDSREVVELAVPKGIPKIRVVEFEPEFHEIATPTPKSSR